MLLSMGTHSIVYRDLIWQLSLRMALNVLDGVEMLDVTIEENEFRHTFLKALKKAMLAFVCISFLLCPLQLVEVKIKGFRTMEDPQMDS